MKVEITLIIQKRINNINNSNIPIINMANQLYQMMLTKMTFGIKIPKVEPPLVETEYKMIPINNNNSIKDIQIQ